MIFVSRRFREAFAQPADVVRYWPAELDRASDAARAQDYRLLRILAWQESMDWKRSVDTKHESVNTQTGEQLTDVLHPQRFLPVAGLVPRIEVFRSAEHRSSILVTDVLAERVMRAGCEGVRFYEPETVGIVSTYEPRHIRMATDGEVEPEYAGLRCPTLKSPKKVTNNSLQKAAPYGYTSNVPIGIISTIEPRHIRKATGVEEEPEYAGPAMVDDDEPEKTMTNSSEKAARYGCTTSNKRNMAAKA